MSSRLSRSLLVLALATLALGGSALQVASIAHSTAGCVRAR